MTRKWTAGDEYMAGNINEIPTTLQMMLRPYEVYVERQAAQAIAADASFDSFPMAAVSWDTVKKNGLGAAVNLSGDATAVTIEQAGWFEVTYGYSTSTTPTTTTHHSVSLQLNGVGSGAGWVDDDSLTRADIRHQVAGAIQSATIRRVYTGYFSVGDVLRMRLSSWTAYSTQTGTLLRTFMRARWTSL